MAFKLLQVRVDVPGFPANLTLRGAVFQMIKLFLNLIISLYQKSCTY